MAVPYLSDDTVPAYTDAGGYPILYGDDDVCPKCAPKNGLTADDGHVYYEGAPSVCPDCGETTDSAYGDPDDESEEGAA